MLYKRTLCMVFAGLIALCCLGTPSKAIYTAEQDLKTELPAPRATDYFRVNVPEKELFTADTGFYLETGETVTIQANYSPASASVDFGLIAPDSLFYPLRASNGSFKGAIQINERGEYILAIRNNSSGMISVSGSVTY